MKYEMKSENLSINVEMINGDIQIVGEERQDIEIDFSNLRKNAAEEIFDIFFENDNLKISQKSKKLSQFSDSEDYSVKIMLPKTVVVTAEIHNISGDIKVTDLMFLKGVAKSKSGDISVSNIAQFDTELASISGDINTANTNGIIKSSTISGDISISSSEYSKIILKSVSGDIDLNCSFDLNEDAIINSVSGDISINFLKYSGDNNLILKTVSGDVDITGDKPADDRIKISQVKGDFSKFNPIGKEFFKGSFGNMFKNLKDHIKNVSENSATSEIRQTKEKDHNIQSILDMVAHGKITVDEAEKLIKALK